MSEERELIGFRIRRNVHGRWQYAREFDDRPDWTEGVHLAALYASADHARASRKLIRFGTGAKIVRLYLRRKVKL
jgi:hypothetical protein